MTDILTLIEEAEYAVDTYENPDLTEFRDAINPICIALGLGSSGYDKITNIHQRSGFLHISTEYEVRCCRQTGKFEIPMDIIRAENPVLEAGLLLRKQAVENAKKKMDDAMKSFEYANARVAEEIDELEKFKEENGIK